MPLITISFFLLINENQRTVSSSQGGEDRKKRQKDLGEGRRCKGRGFKEINTPK